MQHRPLTVARHRYGERVDWTDDDDLEGLELELGAALTGAGLRLSPVAPSSARQPDVLFVHPAVVPDALIQVVAAMGPRLVFLNPETFDPDDEISSDDEGVKDAARLHAGELFRLSVTWACDGILYTWFATTSWYDQLTNEDEIAEYQRRGISRLEWELEREQTSAGWQQLMELVLAAPQVRAASMNQRSTQVRLIIDAHPEMQGRFFSESRFLSAARQRANMEVANWETQLADDEELTVRICEESQHLRGIGRQRAKTAEILREAADGWTLSAAFVERMLARARA